MKSKRRRHIKLATRGSSSARQRNDNARNSSAVNTQRGIEKASLGLRERNKRSKERLIREAARRLFSEKGYEATTLREVAVAADVGFGTVASYSTDKAGLLAMVYVEELKALPPLFSNANQPDDVLEALVAGLAQLYMFWAKVPWLSRYVLQQMEFYRTNPHMDLIVERRRQARQELTMWLETLQRARKIKASVDIKQATDTLFAVYASAVREWSTETPENVPAGLERLRWLMRLPINSLLP
jgi:AcrR family transcriptional regulator